MLPTASPLASRTIWDDDTVNPFMDEKIELRP